ncbi:MAG TPA: UDP-N-acetylmuramate dehydrogenase [Acidobacteriaceae bacterium]
MEIREQVALAGYTTFGVGGAARYFAEARYEGDVAEAVRWADERGLPLFLLGGGSNLLVPDEGFDGLVLHMGIAGVEGDEAGGFDVGAGESWDGTVARTVAQGFAGVECLAGIPGSVGGTPVQNVGAYGQEVSETIVSVRVFDRKHRQFVEMSNAECGFRYRESVFNTTQRGRYIVTRVRFQLRPGGEATLKYADLRAWFGEDKNLDAKFAEGAKFREGKPTLGEVAEAVREIRLGKGMLIVPGDADSRSAGSFFKNPIVTVEVAEEIPGIPRWGAGEGLVKLPAAWLLERAGFAKGYGSGAVRISSRHTLALTNRGGATFADVVAMEKEIVAGVEAKFGVRLEREPVVLG